jgi:hypothetical protein
MATFLDRTKPRRFSKPSRFRISFRQDCLKSFFIRAPFPAFATHPPPRRGIQTSRSIRGAGEVSCGVRCFHLTQATRFLPSNHSGLQIRNSHHISLTTNYLALNSFIFLTFNFRISDENTLQHHNPEQPSPLTNH